MNTGTSMQMVYMIQKNNTGPCLPRTGLIYGPSVYASRFWHQYQMWPLPRASPAAVDGGAAAAHHVAAVDLASTSKRLDALAIAVWNAAWRSSSVNTGTNASLSAGKSTQRAIQTAPARIIGGSRPSGCVRIQSAMRASNM